jgi:hypothetical protein
VRVAGGQGASGSSVDRAREGRIRFSGSARGAKPCTVRGTKAARVQGAAPEGGANAPLSANSRGREGGTRLAEGSLRGGTRTCEEIRWGPWA